MRVEGSRFEVKVLALRVQDLESRVQGLGHWGEGLPLHHELLARRVRERGNKLPVVRQPEVHHLVRVRG